MNISTYYVKIKDIWEQLNAFLKQHKAEFIGCTYGVAAKEKEEQRLHEFVITLNDAYGVVSSNLSCKDQLSSLPNVYALLALEEMIIGRT